MIDRLAAALAETLSRPVASARPIAGGSICDAWRIRLDDDTDVFVKTYDRPPPGFFSVEAAGLSWLSGGMDGSIGVPAVVAWSDGDPAFLAVDWIEPTVGAAPVAGHGEIEEQFGRGLAALHRAGATTFGWDRDGYVGSLPQSNVATTAWADFYRDHRLEPLIRRALDRGALPSTSSASFDRVLGRLDELVGPPEPPARLHGDLWSGNRLVGDDRSWLIDPAPYGGHREIDLAMMRLFGGFGERAFDAYHEVFTLADGHRERVALYQLYPLLVHVSLFGPGYTGQTLAALRHYT